MDSIVMKNMKFFGYHGVLEHESINGQNFYIDVELRADLSIAGNSDNLNDTIDYGAVFEIVRNIVEKERFQLIEKLASVISREILSSFDKIEEIIVRVRKPQAPIDGEFDWMQVEIMRTKHEK